MGEISTDEMGLFNNTRMSNIFQEHCESLASLAADTPMSNTALLQLIGLTAMMVSGFVCTKNIWDAIKRRRAKVLCVVIGAGPTGLTAAVVAVKSSKVASVVIFEEHTKNELINRNYQLAFDPERVVFLKGLGVDFDNMEGCWSDECFFTPVGVYVEYLIGMLHRIHIPVEFKFGRKFKSEKEVPGYCRSVVIVCDGANGSAARILGLNETYVQHSCQAYGAVALIDRSDLRQVPRPEKRVHDLNFDLTAYGTDTSRVDGSPGFHLKIFGCSQTRLMSLVVPKFDSELIRCIRTILDKSVMRNIFLKCFNTYRSDADRGISDSFALKRMKFSPRLFEIRLSQREEVTSYFEDDDTFVVVEGEAARSYNFHTGLDVNIALKSLESLHTFINMAACADNETAILQTLILKTKHADDICKDFIKFGLKNYMYT